VVAWAPRPCIRDASRDRTERGTQIRWQIRDRLPPVLPHVIAVPAAEHGFLPRVEIHALNPLHMQVAEKALVPSAEAEQRDGRGHADVYTDHAALDFAHEFSRARSTGGEDAGAVAVFDRVHRL